MTFVLGYLLFAYAVGGVATGLTNALAPRASLRPPIWGAVALAVFWPVDVIAGIYDQLRDAAEGIENNAAEEDARFVAMRSRMKLVEQADGARDKNIGEILARIESIEKSLGGIRS